MINEEEKRWLTGFLQARLSTAAPALVAKIVLSDLDPHEGRKISGEGDPLSRVAPFADKHGARR
jgi:hypothetical protein